MADTTPTETLQKGSVPRSGLNIPMPAGAKPPPPAPSSAKPAK
jgi:hypothetical protein